MSEAVKKFAQSERRQFLLLTDRAACELLASIKDRRQSCGRTLGVRVKLSSKGCHGNEFEMEYVEEYGKHDYVVEIYHNDNDSDESEPINIFLDPKTALMIIGTIVDYIDTQFEKGFTFKHPKEKGRCGCGKSFSY